MCEFYFSGFLLTEITTPFISMRWFLHNLRLDDSTLYKINGLFVILFWVAVRIAFCGFLGYLALYVEISFLDSVMTVFVPLILLTAVTFNVMWFRLIMKAALSAFFPPSNKKE